MKKFILIHLVGVVVVFVLSLIVSLSMEGKDSVVVFVVFTSMAAVFVATFRNASTTAFMATIVATTASSTAFVTAVPVVEIVAVFGVAAGALTLAGALATANKCGVSNFSVALITTVAMETEIVVLVFIPRWL